MTWFKVDDGLHSHPKALAASLPALGLWVVAGSWSSDHLTDGLVPEHVIALLSRGEIELAEELVSTGLWRKVKGGYRFHQWHEDGDGSKRNPTRVEITALRQARAEAGRKGGLARASNPQANGQASARRPAKQRAKQKRSTRGTTPDPTRPDPEGLPDSSELW